MSAREGPNARLVDMNDPTIGRSLRALRIRGRLRQKDLAGRVGVSQQLISKMEAGHLDRVGTRTLRRIFEGVDAEVAMVVRWRAGELDRLLDEGHAAPSGASAPCYGDAAGLS